MVKRCALVTAGKKTYEEGLQLQKWAWERVASGEFAGIMILLEHFPVITLGRGYSTGDLLLPINGYESRGIEVVQCNRGGKITCHNPGQLVGYPVFNLGGWKKDSHWYLRAIEQIIINTVKYFGLPAERKDGYTGVWTNGRKIAAIGVAVRHWITSHGFALNIDNDLTIFNTVVPCGIHEFGVTSLSAEGKNGVSVEDAAKIIIGEFEQVLSCSFVPGGG